MVIKQTSLPVGYRANFSRQQHKRPGLVTPPHAVEGDSIVSSNDFADLPQGGAARRVTRAHSARCRYQPQSVS